MKNLTLAFAVAMTLMTFGCKKKGGADGAGEAMAKMTEFKDEMCKCKDARCAQDVSARMTAWTQEQAKGQPARMSDADIKKAQQIGEELGTCMAKAMTAAGSAAPGATEPGGSAAGSAAVDPAALADLPQECLDYRAAVERLTACDKLPADVRDVLKQRFDESVTGWTKLPAEAKRSLGPACKAGADAVIANSKQCGS